jgi:hypothetical protein
MVLPMASFEDIYFFGYVQFTKGFVALTMHIQTFRTIYMGKSSALDGKRTASASSLSEKNGMKTATPETVAYAALQVSC